MEDLRPSYKHNIIIEFNVIGITETEVHKNHKYLHAKTTYARSYPFSQIL